MVADDYWEDDELQDRLYHAQERERLELTQRHVSVSGAHLSWSWRRVRNILKAPWVLGLLFIAWWWMTSGEKPVKVDWSRFAYSQYATDTQSLCNALMVFESLQKLGSKADRMLLYPREWTQQRDERTGWLMQVAEQKLGVKLQPVDLLGADQNTHGPGTIDKPTFIDWNLSITKIRVFELVQYERVLHLDSDITLLQHMDELFFMPKTPIAMPRAYWSDVPPAYMPLTSIVMLVDPNPNEVLAMMETLRQWQQAPDYLKSKKYDMDIINHRFGGSAMVLPHRPYAMLTAEFRAHNHSTYLGYLHGHESDVRGKWDPDKAFKEAKLVHFSDWPLPKPWIMWPVEGLAEMQPDCSNTKKTCREREIWKGLYDDFRLRRKNLCKILSVPAPEWKSWKHSMGAGG
jgi:hypothetical protein